MVAVGDCSLYWLRKKVWCCGQIAILKKQGVRNIGGWQKNQIKNTNKLTFASFSFQVARGEQGQWAMSPSLTVGGEAAMWTDSSLIEKTGVRNHWNDEKLMTKHKQTHYPVFSLWVARGGWWWKVIASFVDWGKWALWMDNNWIKKQGVRNL